MPYIFFFFYVSVVTVPYVLELIIEYYSIGVE